MLHPNLRHIAGLLMLAVLLPALIIMHSPDAVRAGDPTTQVIESDSDSVTQQGSWQVVSDSAASGGGYLVGAGEANALALTTEGSLLEVIYVAGPQYGTLAIEIDGAVVRTVITTDSAVKYNQKATFEYLEAGEHAVRVYAAEGQVAVDAFITLAPNNPQAATNSPGPQSNVAPRTTAKVTTVNYPPALNTAQSIYEATPMIEWEVPSPAPDWYQVKVTNTGTGDLLFQTWIEASTYCTGITCYYKDPVKLTGGNQLTLSIQTYDNDTGMGLWSDEHVFYVQIPVMTSPGGTASASTGLVTYSWNVTSNNGNETHYQLYVSGSDGYVFTDWYEASAHCNTASTPHCSVTPAGYERVQKINVEYKWFVRVYGPKGYGPWNGPVDYKISATAPGLATNLTEDLNSGYPEFTWDHASNRSWYRLIVHDDTTNTTLHDKWYQVHNTIACFATCNIIPGVALPDGEYTWYVQSYGSAGLNENFASKTLSIDLPKPGPPIVGFNVRSSQTLGDSFPYADLIFDWTVPLYASWYQLYIAGPDGTMLYNKWHDDCVNPGSTTCSIAPDIIFSQNGTYSWYVQAWGSGGTSAWSSMNTFTYDMTIPDVPDTMDAPSGTITDGNPDFSFTYNGEPDGIYYELYVATASGTKIHQNWYKTNGCSAYPCIPVITGSRHELELTPGDYVWYVRAWNPGGTGPWSGPQQFTVASATTAIPSQNYPTTLSILTTAPVEFSWYGAGYATWYRLQILEEGSLTNVLYDKWYRCYISICYATVSEAEMPSGNLWWRVQAYSGPGGIGAWSPTNMLNLLRKN